MPNICEGHLTFDIDPESGYANHGYWSRIEEVGKKHGFHFSQIAGWDELGQGTRGFLTSHDDVIAINSRMERVIDDLVTLNIYCRRKKIEATILDERY